MTSLMCGVLLLSLIRTSRQTDYLLSLGVTVFAGGVALWVAAAFGAGSAAGLGVITLVLIATTAYARFLWKRERPQTDRLRTRAVRLREPR